MKISELREWASREYGAHSHKEGQVLAALGPLEEWLGHLARHGVNFELVPTELAKMLPPSLAKPIHAVDEPPTPVNSGGTSEAGVDVVDVPMPDPAGFVTESDPSGPPPEAPILGATSDAEFADEGAPK